MFCRSLFVLFLLYIVLFVFLCIVFYLDHCFYCKSKDRQYNGQSLRKNNDIQNITQKDRQYNSQTKKDKQWSIYKTLHRRTDNTMFKRKRTNNDLQNITQKDRQFNGQKKCLSFCVMFCISLFFLRLWPLYCLSFDLRLLITILVSSNCSQYPPDTGNFSQYWLSCLGPLVYWINCGMYFWNRYWH
jgi:hypothetical protein